MRRSAAGLGAFAIAALIAGPSTAAGQHLIEARGADTEYRYFDWNHTWATGAVVDVFYVGVPGSNEFNLGGGYSLRRGCLVVTPLVYAVIGKEASQRGIKVAMLLSVDHRGWKLVSFIGQYLRVSGEVDGYLVMDALDLTRTVGQRLELGIQSGFFRTAGEWNQQTGPLIKLNDRHGTWAASYRFGSEDEFRIGRVITF